MSHEVVEDLAGMEMDTLEEGHEVATNGSIFVANVGSLTHGQSNDPKSTLKQSSLHPHHSPITFEAAQASPDTPSQSPSGILPALQTAPIDALPVAGSTTIPAIPSLVTTGSPLPLSVEVDQRPVNEASTAATDERVDLQSLGYTIASGQAGGKAAVLATDAPSSTLPLTPSQATVPLVKPQAESTARTALPPLAAPTKLSLPINPSLPPRPPPQAQPASHPNYSPQDDIRSYHSHDPPPPTLVAPDKRSSNPPPGLSQISRSVPAISPYTPGKSAYYVSAPGLGPPPLSSTGAPGTSPQPRSGLPPPPIASFQQVSGIASVQPPSQPVLQTTVSRISNQASRQKVSLSGSPIEEDDQQWGADVQAIYDAFLHQERVYVTEGQWDRFPSGSRVFVGNLPSDKITKRDIFHVFHSYGTLAQISIKQAFGFVQFHDARAAHRAVQMEQGTLIRGNRVHLEISRPQSQRNSQSVKIDVGVPGSGGRGGRRSRSPDSYSGRGQPLSPRYASVAQDMRVDRGVHNYPRSDHDRGSSDARDSRGDRDSYRSRRSPTPPRRSFAAFDDYRDGFPRRDSYNRGRSRSRSRSRSPYRRGSPPTHRYRSRSPTGRSPSLLNDDTLPLARRSAKDIPECQILVLDHSIGRSFVDHVLTTLRSRTLTADILLINATLPLDLVIKRQILEGVVAVCRLTSAEERSGRIPLQVFDRSGGVDHVRFEEYIDLEPRVAAELIVRAKAKNGVPITSNREREAYPSSTLATQQSAIAPTGLASSTSRSQGTDLSALMNNIDGTRLQSLLASLQGPTSRPTQAYPPTSPQTQPPPSTPDLASLLASLTGPPTPMGPTGSISTSTPQSAHQAISAIPPAGYLGDGGPQIRNGAKEQQVKDIMASLARWKG